MLAASGADAVMIGRGAYGRPWLPGQVGQYLNNRVRLPEPSGEEFAGLVLDHYDMLLSHYGVEAGLRIARKHLGWYFDAWEAAGGQLSSAVKQTVMTSRKPDEVIGLVRGNLDARKEQAAA